MTDPERNKVAAAAFYDLMFHECRPAEAIDRYVGDRYWPGDRDHAGIDIVRFDGDGKIVEHWDVLQVVPDHSANSNSMF